MTKFTSHEPGSFCWIELATSDDAGGKAFYTQLFGWTVIENDMGPMGTYSIFQKDGAACAAMYKIPPDMAGMPPNWTSYVTVADADASTEKAKSLGATVHMGPFDVEDFGRMSFLSDPQGANFAIWQAKKNVGVGIRDEPGTLCWNELHVRDLGAAKKFYPELFGWKMKESPEYTEWYLGDRAIGGMMPAQGPPEAPSFWMPYFSVADCDETVATAQSLGAAVHVPPFDAANVGRMAVLSDPQGAFFSVIHLKM
jgi:hypothetical protein